MKSYKKRRTVSYRKTGKISSLFYKLRDLVDKNTNHVGIIVHLVFLYPNGIPMLQYSRYGLFSGKLTIFEGYKKINRFCYRKIKELRMEKK